MQFEVRVTPTFEDISEDPEFQEQEFISLDIAGATARWTYDGVRFDVVFDHYGEGAAPKRLKPVVRQPSAVSDAGTEQPVSCGTLIFQQRGPETMHVEYQPEKILGRAMDSMASSEAHLETEEMLKSWLRTNDPDAVTVIQKESGELR